MKNNNEHFFSSQGDLVFSLGKKIISNLEKAILEKGKASLLVSGGSTPKSLFNELSLYNISWDKVNIALCDERWIDSKNKYSNVNLVRTTLLNNFAKSANFISMYQEDINIEDAEKVCSDIYKNELFPFDVLILGMGNDGHTASLFPENIKLKMAFEEEDNLCISMTPKDVPYKRMSLTKKAILSADNIYLHFEGEEKQKVYEQIKDGIDSFKMPISEILNDSKKKIEVYYK